MRKVLFILSIMFSMVLGSTAAFASVNDDQVTSQKIKEADGTSAQNTNSGAGVKTNHIQNSAVTSAKIADGAVTTSKIPASAVTTTNIANGAVTDAKISGLISGSKISSTGLNADTVDGQHASAFAAASHTQAMSTVNGLESSLAGKSDVTHNHDTLYQQKYGKVAVVAQTGGDYIDPVTAMTNIAAWCGTPSATNPCLLKIMPGVYDIGGNTLYMQPYVDMEGAGENVTKLIGSGGITVYVVSNPSEIRFISLENNCDTCTSTMAIYNEFSSPKITNVTAVARGGFYSTAISNYSASPIITNVTAIGVNGVVAIGIRNQNSSSPLIKNSIASASNGSSDNYGIFNTSSSDATLMNATTSASGPSSCGINSAAATVKIDASVIEGSGCSLINAAGASAFIGNTKMSGVIINVGASLKCVGVYDGNYDQYNCP